MAHKVECAESLEKQDFTDTLQSLKNIKRRKPKRFSKQYDEDMLKNDIKTIEKGIKALELIKKHFKFSFYDIGKYISVEEANNFWHMRCVICKKIDRKSEYELLKEVLE